jgi:hypothetical protein
VVDALQPGRVARLLARLDPGLPLASGLCSACVEVLGAQGGALTLLPTGVERLSASTSDAVTRRLEDLQEVLGEGPGRLAYVENRPVALSLSRDAEEPPALSLFASAAAGVRASAGVVAVPLRLDRRPLGSLTLYQETGRAPIPTDDAQPLADTACAVLLGSRAPLEQQWPDQTRRHRAIGMVIAQLRVGPDDALAVLRGRALSRASTLAAVIDDVLERRLSFGSARAS